MESTLLSEKLANYMKQSDDFNDEQNQTFTQGTIEIVGNFIYDAYVPDCWHLIDIERFDDKFIFHWTSSTQQTICPECGTTSYNRTNTYRPRSLQDLPVSGMTVYHLIKSNRYFCKNPECDSHTFVEQFQGIAIKDARLTDRLKDFIIRQGIESTSSGTARALLKIGIRVSRETINRLLKKKGAQVVTQNLTRNDVEALSIDDINLRKGNSSTACSVIIDAQTHRALAIVKGATSDIAIKVMQQYPDTNIISRDRGTAYAKAAKKLDKIQVADGFHLVKNIHKVIKDVLSLETSHDLFLREGEGWNTNENSSPASDGSKRENDNGPILIKSEIITDDDIEKRIHFAGLNERQAWKYRKTMAIIELAESGMRTPEIAKRLSMKIADVRNYRKDARRTIENAEQKIDEYFKMVDKGQWEYHQRTIAKNARPSSESIVAPYSDTVLRMFKEGKNHRNIHPVIVQEGFTGSVNAVYQYLIKYAHENDIPYGRNARVIPVEDRKNRDKLSRPPRISVDRVSRRTIYNSILSKAASKKEELKQTLQGLIESDDSHDKVENNKTKTWVNNTNYADSIAEIIFDTKPKNKKNVDKEKNEEIFERIINTLDIIPYLQTFLDDFYEILLSLDVGKLDKFISKYKDDSCEPISVFASGLKKDYEAVKNCLLYSHISNGPMEGTNNKIKMIRKRGYGRVGLELLNALVVLPWYYKDIDENNGIHNKSAA